MFCSDLGDINLCVVGCTYLATDLHCAAREHADHHGRRTGLRVHLVDVAVDLLHVVHLGHRCRRSGCLAVGCITAYRVQ